MNRLRIATRQSRLALTQTRWVASELQGHNPGLTVEEVHVVTRGDQIVDRPLYEVGGKALFVSEVEARVAGGEAELAVHSLKDFPGDQPPAEGLGLLCFPKREDPRDVVVTRDGEEFMGLRAGSRIGTTSLRRVAQLRQHRPDLRYDTLRGNVETRLARLDAGDFDAIILAAAGLHRLGLAASRKLEYLSVEMCVPAVGQGTLGLEGRVDDAALEAVLAPLADWNTRLVTECERAFLVRMQGNCHVPLAGHAFLSDDGLLSMVAVVSDIEGDRVLRGSGDEYVRERVRDAQLETARKLGSEVADGLLEQGARDLMLAAEIALRQRSGMN